MNSRLMQYTVLALTAGLILIPSIAKAGLVNLTSSRDFQTPANITADASTQLTGLASLAAFQADMRPVPSRFGPLCGYLEVTVGKKA